MEVPVRIACQDFFLEAMYQRNESRDAVILCHPHSLYGGSMDNNVVMALQGVFGRWGWRTVRFNFRGVGVSGGLFDDGVGEADDVVAVASYLAKDRVERIHLAAYSFGAFVGLGAVRKGFRPVTLTLISPPLDFMDFAGLELPGVPCLVTLGNTDDFCSIESLKEWLARQPRDGDAARVEILQMTDHFYSGREGKLAACVEHFLKDLQGT